jgi:hypothetical protein
VITTGLEAGEWVVVTGHQRAAHGDALMITNEDALATGSAARERPAAEAVEGRDG